MENENLDSVNEYFKHLNQVTKDLDRDEVNKLWRLAKSGDADAKNKIMEMNLRLVIPTAKRFQRPGMDLMDLIEEGNLGLIQAIDKFEPAKGYRFSTYAVYWIEQYIRKYIEEQSGAIKIPSHAWGNLKKWFRAWNALKEANGRDPSLNEMAKELDLSARQVKSIMDTLSAAKGVDSLATLVGDEDELTLEDMISDDGKGNPHDVFMRAENMAELKKSLQELNDRDREILVMRYGLVDNEPKTLGEVAEKLGLSRERVRQIEERAVNLLRRSAQKAGLLERGVSAFNTRKLHGGMQIKQKTNILGEVISRGPLARLLKQRDELIKAQKAKAAKKAKKAGKISLSPKNVVKKTAETVQKKNTVKSVTGKNKAVQKAASKKQAASVSRQLLKNVSTVSAKKKK